MKETKFGNRILVNEDCISEVQVINDSALKFTLRNGENMIIPVSAFHGSNGCDAKEEKYPIPKIVPVTGMFAMFEIEGEVRGCNAHMLSMMENGLQPMMIVLGELVNLTDVPGYIGLGLDPKRKLISLDEARL